MRCAADDARPDRRPILRGLPPSCRLRRATSGEHRVRPALGDLEEQVVPAAHPLGRCDGRFVKPIEETVPRRGDPRSRSPQGTAR